MSTDLNKKQQFQCDICSFRTSKMSGVRRHMQIHADNRRHACDKCGNSYGLKKNLVNHQRGKHSEFIYAYVCPECVEKPTTFVSAYLLRHHFKERHDRAFSIAEMEKHKTSSLNTGETYLGLFEL